MKKALLDSGTTEFVLRQEFIMKLELVHDGHYQQSTSIRQLSMIGNLNRMQQYISLINH